MSKYVRRAMALVVIGFSVIAQSHGAAFIKFEGVDGEASDSDHEGWCDLLNVSQGITRPSSGASGATRRRGDVVLEDIVCTKELDKASPKLTEAVCKGTTYPTVKIHLATSNPDGTPDTVYYQIELTNVRVVSLVVLHGEGPIPDAEDRPVEHISLNYTEFKVTYIPNRDGSPPSWEPVQYKYTP